MELGKYLKQQAENNKLNNQFLVNLFASAMFVVMAVTVLLFLSGAFEKTVCIPVSLLKGG